MQEVTKVHRPLPEGCEELIIRKGNVIYMPEEHQRSPQLVSA
jgi:hypothetical protein